MEPPISDHGIVVGVRTDPEPQEAFINPKSQRAIARTNAKRPEAAHLLQLKGRMSWIFFEESAISYRPEPGRLPEASRRIARMPDWRNASQFARATAPEVRKRLLGQPIEPARRSVTLDLLIETGRLEFLEPGPEAVELIDRQFSYGFFRCLPGSP